MTEIELPRYRVATELGANEFCRVVLAIRNRAPLPDQVSAVKICRKESVRKHHRVQQIWNERNMLSEIRHPFISQMESSFAARDSVYIFVSYNGGGQLSSHLRKVKTFPIGVTKFYACEVLSALQYLHSMKIVFRDVQPVNIMLDHEGHVKLSNFLVAKKVTDENDQTFLEGGSPEYFSPEMVSRQKQSFPVDFWAFGILLYEFMVGSTPFRADTRNMLYTRIQQEVPQLPAQMPQSACNLIMHLLEKDQSMRLGTANGVVDIMKHVFFAGIDWELVRQRKYTPPIHPDLAHASDVRHFHAQPCTLQIEEHSSIKDEFTGF